MVYSLSQRLVGRYFAVLLAASGVITALVHPLPNLTDMSAAHRSVITATCLIGAVVIWYAPWDRWAAWTLQLLPPVGLAVKMGSNLLGGLGPYSYSIHFMLIYVWMGVALPRGSSLAHAPLLAGAYVVPLALQGDPRQVASVALVVPTCVIIGESVAWISNRLREAERVDGQRMRWMSWLLASSERLMACSDRATLARQVAQLACELPGAAGAAVLLSGNGRKLEVAALESWPSVALPEAFVTQQQPALREAIRGRASLSMEDPSCAALAEELGLAQLSIAPLFGANACRGVVLLSRNLGSEPMGPFMDPIVQTLSMQAGLVLDRVVASEALLDDSLRDPLTGIGNRRAADAALAHIEAEDALLLLDLDHFKRVNDTRGHAAGDELLRELGEYLSSALRETDSVFRMGGEEFLVSLRGAGEGALLASERLLSGWRLREPLTSFSGGVAMYREGSSASQILAAADEALYEAKAAGRDQVRLASISS